MEAHTKQFKKRNAILTCLRETDTHPSAEMVHEMLQAEHPDISLATVYRNLAKFKAEGKIMSVATGTGTVCSRNSRSESSCLARATAPSGAGHHRLHSQDM